MRELRLRESERVARYGSQLLRKAASGLPLEESEPPLPGLMQAPTNACYLSHAALAGLLVAEQTALAAMDCNSMELAFSLVNDLRKRFPNSQRALRLVVRWAECDWHSSKKCQTRP